MEEQERVMQWKFWLEGVLIPAVGLPGFLGEDHDGGDDGDDDEGDHCHVLVIMVMVMKMMMS